MRLVPAGIRAEEGRAARCLTGLKSAPWRLEFGLHQSQIASYKVPASQKLGNQGYNYDATFPGAAATFPEPPTRVPGQCRGLAP